VSRRRSGRIVNIGSVSGITAMPFGGSYSGTKAAVHLISDALRMELRPFGIDVITVQPGAVLSGFGKRASTGIARFREDSRYSAVADSIEARAMASQADGMPTAEFARWLVGEVTAQRPQAVSRAGTSSSLLPALAKLPVRLRDAILSRKFGLDRLRRA
jgi:short-subunit dehydrogenase